MDFIRSFRLPLALIPLVSGCFQSVLVPEEEDAPQHFEIPFDRYVFAASGAPYGVHLQAGTSTPESSSTFLLGIEPSGNVVYEHHFDGPVMLVGPVSDAQGRPYVVHRASSPDPMDFGFGPQLPLGRTGPYGTLVAYTSEGSPRFAVPIPTGESALHAFTGIDVSDEGIVVVCGSTRVVSGMVAVWVFEADGTLRAHAELREPALERRASCAIDEDGNVLLYGPETDLDHSSASVANSGLVLLDSDLRERAQFVHSGTLLSLEADPRGHFVVLSAAASHDTMYVGPHAIAPPRHGGVLISTIARSRTSVNMVARTEDLGSFRSVPLLHDAHGVLAPYSFRASVLVPTGALEANAPAAVAFLELDDDDTIAPPVVTPLAGEEAAPSFAGMMGRALVLVNEREGRLVLDVHRRLRPRR